MKIAHFKGNGTVSLANEHEFEGLGLGNDIAISDDGWAIMPYGEWPHTEGLQRFTRESAEKMVGYFKSGWNTVKRVIRGLPVFKGHPDLPGLANQYPDKKEYGYVSDMEARTEGLAIRMTVGEGGEKIIKGGMKFISPHWLANEIGRTSTNKPIYEPVYMKSVGLTDKPNIPNHSLLNTADAGSQKQNNTENTTMPEWLKKLLGLANEATEAEATTKIQGLLARPEPSALTNEQAAKSAAEGKLVPLENEVKQLKADLASTRTALANERKIRRDDLIAGAIRSGKIAEADKAVWEKRLTANFDEESKALGNAQNVIKTKALTKDLKEGSLANDDMDADIGDLVNTQMAKMMHIPQQAGNRYNKAFAAVKSAHPKLFDPVLTLAGQ